MKNVFEQIKIIEHQLNRYFTQKCIHLYIEHILNVILSTEIYLFFSQENVFTNYQKSHLQNYIKIFNESLFFIN